MDDRIQDKIRADMEWWGEHKAELSAKYKGMHIAVGDQQVVASYSLEDLGKLAIQKGIDISFTSYIEDDKEYHCFSESPEFC